MYMTDVNISLHHPSVKENNDSLLTFLRFAFRELIGNDSRVIRVLSDYCIFRRLTEIMVKSTEPKSDTDKQKNTLDIGLLEEDDEFEEFPVEEWTSHDEEDKEANVWEDNWDDDNVEDDFSVQLRAEFEKQNIPATF